MTGSLPASLPAFAAGFAMAAGQWWGAILALGLAVYLELHGNMGR